MASIKKTKSGSYQATVYVGRDENGKQLFEYITMPGLKECKLAAKELELEIESMGYKASNLRNLSVVDWLKQWVDLNKDRLSPGTVKIYHHYIDAHYEPFFSKKKLKDIANNEILLRKFMAQKLETLTANTVCKLMTVLSKALREALRDKNPCKYIELPQKEKYVPHVPNQEEFNDILKAIEGTIDELFVLLASWCGFRLGEICAIDISSDVNFKNSTITINKSISKSENGWVIKPPKSSNGKRVVVAPDELMLLLKKYISDEGRISGRLFNYYPDSYSKRWRDLVKEKKLPKVRFHDFRHYHATWLYNQKFPDHYAAKRMGHDINTLKGIYQHLGLSEEEKLNEAIRNKKIAK